MYLRLVQSVQHSARASQLNRQTEGATGQIVALTYVSSILQSAVAYPRWPSASVSGGHRSLGDLASKLPTFMQMSWISEGVSNGTGLQCLSN